jgi:hypothetical protein
MFSYAQKNTDFSRRECWASRRASRAVGLFAPSPSRTLCARWFRFYPSRFVAQKKSEKFGSLEGMVYVCGMIRRGVRGSDMLYNI